MINLYTDASCLQTGYVLKKRGRFVRAGHTVLDNKYTCNEAEYLGVLHGIEAYKTLNTKEPVLICSDSQCIVKQIQGKYKIKAKNLRPFYERVVKALEGVVYSIRWIPGKVNPADAPSRNLPMDVGIPLGMKVRRKRPRK